MPTIAEAADTLNITKGSVYSLIHKKKLESDGHGIVSDESLGNYIEKRRPRKRSEQNTDAEKNKQCNLDDSHTKRIPAWLKELIMRAYEQGKTDGAMEVADAMRHLEHITLEEILR